MTPKPQNTHFPANTPIEISSNDSGFRGSWYRGTVLRTLKTKPTKNLVQYQDLVSDHDPSKPLCEELDISQLRPVPPLEKRREYKVGDEVDAYYNDGWWEGVVTEGLGGGRFKVFFRSSREEMEFGAEEMRVHRDWINGKWIPPLVDEEKVSVTTEEKASEATTVEKYSKGTLVEVSSDEDGFQGAWFAATVVESAGKDKFLVQYQSLRTDDDSDFLREEIDTLHIRPCPPETVVFNRFNLLEEVDALYNDGWWVGVISEVLGSSKYKVYFRGSNEELEFKHTELRLHQEWIDGKWIMASQALKL